MKSLFAYEEIFRLICRVLGGAFFRICSVRFGAANRTLPHRKIFAFLITTPHRTVGVTISESRPEPDRRA